MPEFTWDLEKFDIWDLKWFFPCRQRNLILLIFYMRFVYLWYLKIPTSLINIDSMITKIVVTFEALKDDERKIGWNKWALWIRLLSFCARILHLQVVEFTKIFLFMPKTIIIWGMVNKVIDIIVQNLFTYVILYQRSKTLLNT